MALVSQVLILVLVEHTLGGTTQKRPCSPLGCLNPCFSGTYSRRIKTANGEVEIVRLNPCFSGTYSRSPRDDTLQRHSDVLILVLVEHTLGDGEYQYIIQTKSLNPCFSGTYSRRALSAQLT